MPHWRQFGGIIIPVADVDDANDDAELAGIGRPFTVELQDEQGVPRYYACVMPMDIATKTVLSKIAANYSGEWMKDPEDDGRPPKKKQVKRFKKKAAKKKKLKIPKKKKKKIKGSKKKGAKKKGQ